MMRIYDEAIQANRQKMIHHISDDRPSSNLQERFWKSVCQRSKPSPQPGTEDKSCLEPPFIQ
jgi:hypothetical protein